MIKTIYLGQSSAMMARANHNLAMNLFNTRGQSALFGDCFGCQSPHMRNMAA